MNLEKYLVRASRNQRRFEFISKGPMGNIKKVVEFEKFSQNYFNLLFGDWDKKKRKIDPQIRSNNGDRDKVLATVAYTVIQFLNHHIDAEIGIKGQTKARTRLYQMGINKYLNELSLSCQIKGLTNSTSEEFLSGKNYEMFIVRKNTKIEHI